MSLSDSFIVASASASASPDSSYDPDEIDSLPSSLDSSDLESSDGTGHVSDAQKEWEASLQQLELVLTMVIVPYAGKYFGRKFAYWSWAKYMQWMYPVEVRITSSSTFTAAGAVEAAASI